MTSGTGYSIRAKLMGLVLATAFLALAIFAAAMVYNDVSSYERTVVADLRTQADLMARATAPALAFNDPKTANDNLALLSVRPQIVSAAIYGQDGRRFAAYARQPSDGESLPAQPGAEGYAIGPGEIALFHQVIENGEAVGTLYLRARYELRERLLNYMVILAAAMAASLLAAGLMASRLLKSIMRPIQAITRVARGVMQRRDFSLRAEKTTNDEIAVLVDAFNGMLEEMGQRTQAVEQSNQNLAREMTVRQKAEQALLTADRRKDEFLATLAHELRNPLAPMSTALAILNMGQADAATAARARDIIGRQIRQMVRLVDDLLDVSRITTGKLAIQTRRISLQDVVQDALETATPFIQSHGHELEVHLPQEVLYVEGDATRLAQVVANLLNNAAKYTNRGGRIELDVARKGSDAEISVSDNGIGIAPDMLGHVFEMFIQADSSLERSNAGLGVGLSLARRLVELHGGSIMAYSEGAQRGSRFVVTLPLAGAAQDEAPPSASPVAAGSGPYRILLADDNVDFANTMAALMEALGHEVKVTHDGAAALVAAPGFKPDFAFLDIGLPKLNGYDLARRIHALPECGNTVLVAITGWGQERDKQLAREAGFFRHMVKPVRLEQIQAIFEEAASRPSEGSQK